MDRYRSRTASVNPLASQAAAQRVIRLSRVCDLASLVVATCVEVVICAQVRLEDPAKYQSIVDAEWNIIYDKLAKCRASGAKVVLSRLAIGDLATQYFADHDIFCAGRVRCLLTNALCVLQCACMRASAQCI